MIPLSYSHLLLIGHDMIPEHWMTLKKILLSTYWCDFPFNLSSIAEFASVPGVYTAPPPHGCFSHLHHCCLHMGWQDNDQPPTLLPLLHWRWLNFYDFTHRRWSWLLVQHPRTRLPSGQLKSVPGTARLILIILLRLHFHFLIILFFSVLYHCLLFLMPFSLSLFLVLLLRRHLRV